MSTADCQYEMLTQSLLTKRRISSLLMSCKLCVRGWVYNSSYIGVKQSVVVSKVMIESMQ